ncbi:hypothetical protein H4582DRAFT_1793645, partial [Lactarius indigo]
WTNIHDGLSEEQRNEINLGVQPVWSMLTKLHWFAYAVKNSTTKLLPQWYTTLASCHLPHRMMPRDVSTWWNSTFDMLKFALDF